MLRPVVGGGEAVLVRSLLVGAEEAGERDLPEAGDVGKLVGRREAVRVLERVVEAHRP